MGGSHLEEMQSAVQSYCPHHKAMSVERLPIKTFYQIGKQCK